MTARPILLNSCARAATAAEARFRITGRVEVPARAARVVALDAGAEPVVRSVAEAPWRGARFLVADHSGPPDPDGGLLRSVTGARTELAAELDGADLALMVATTDAGASVASLIGSACARLGIMTAGLVLGSAPGARGAVTALRPHARVLVVSQDADDVSELLTALRA